jgi:hypothetical protein
MCCSWNSSNPSEILTIDRENVLVLEKFCFVEKSLRFLWNIVGVIYIGDSGFCKDIEVFLTLVK